MMQTFPDPWNVCFATRLLGGPWGGDVLPVYRGQSTGITAIIPNGLVEPVVVRVHANDPACPFGIKCASIAVLDDLVWQGPIEAPPAPTNTQPPSGLSQADAILDAIGISFNNGGSLNPEVVSAVAGPYVTLESDGVIAGDRWVWAVTLRVQVTAPDCPAGNPCPIVLATRTVILDFVIGSLVIMSTSTGPTPAPS